MRRGRELYVGGVLDLEDDSWRDRVGRVTGYEGLVTSLNVRHVETFSWQAWIGDRVKAVR